MTARNRNGLWLISKEKKPVEMMLRDHRRAGKPREPGSDKQQGEKQMTLETVTGGETVLVGSESPR